MGAKRKTWTQKWEEAKAKTGLPSAFDCKKSGKRISIPSAGEVEDVIRGIAYGKVMTTSEVAAELTKKHGSDMCCPLTTGIFAWLLAHYANEAKDDSIPWWRVVKAKKVLNPKYPGAPDLQKGLLESEGISVVAKGNKLFIQP